MSTTIAWKRLSIELAEMFLNAPDNYTAHPVGEDMYNWKATIEGPLDSPYEGGTFNLAMSFSKDYPFKPPRVVFETKVYHLNFSERGVIGVDFLNKGWSPTMTVEKILLKIIQLMKNPIVSSPLDLEKARLYEKDKKKYNENAQEWTKKYAMAEEPREG